MFVRSDRQAVVRIEQRRKGRTRRDAAAVVGIAQQKFTRLHDVDRIGLAQTLIGAANKRLRYAVDEAEGLLLRAGFLHFYEIDSIALRHLM